MLSGLIGSILENRKLKIIIVLSLISLISYFILPVILHPSNDGMNSMIILIVIGVLFLATHVGISIYLKRSGENTLWVLYFFFAIVIFFASAFIGTLLFYMFSYRMPDFSNMYVPLIYLAGYVANLLLYLVFNFATDRDPMGPVIVVFVGFMVVSMAAGFIASFAFNYPSTPTYSSIPLNLSNSSN